MVLQVAGETTGTTVGAQDTGRLNSKPSNPTLPQSLSQNLEH